MRGYGAKPTRVTTGWGEEHVSFRVDSDVKIWLISLKGHSLGWEVTQLEG